MEITRDTSDADYLRIILKRHGWTEPPTFRTVALMAAGRDTKRETLRDAAFAALVAERREQA